MSRKFRSATLSRDLQVDAWGVTITLPKGTRLMSIHAPDGYHWAVHNVALLVELTGNNHDPHYRYLWIPDDVTENQSQED